MSDIRPTGSKNSNELILAFFFITGLTGLAYELVWIRLLILAFGSTQFAVTTVLVVFMAGLALGSLIFGRLIDTHPVPLRVYAGIEIALGVYCILSPWVFSVVRDLYVGFSGVDGSAQRAGFESAQFALSFAALIIPTTLMGGTLPVLVKYLTTASGRIGFHTAVPYSVNTLGAVTGCLFTGFFSLYLLGVKTTVYAAGVVDIAVGLLIFVIFGSARSALKTRAHDAGAGLAGNSSTSQRPPGSKALNLIILLSFALSGFCSLSYEVLWTRVFSLVLGSSVYAFTVMLATFLAGIGFGSILFAPVVDRLKRPLLWFAGFEAVIGFTALYSIFVYRKLPFIFYTLKGSFSEQFWLFQTIQFALCSLIMIIPTLCMGAMFPLVGRLYTRGLSTVGKNIGDIYFMNTTGSIFGSFVAGFILIPVIGVQKGVIATAALNIIIAAVLLNSSGAKALGRGVFTATFAALFVISTVMLPPWEKMVMTTGVYVNPFKAKELELVKKGQTDEELLFYREGINAVITVRRKADTITYQANGKQEASSIGGRPSVAWALLGHIPLLLHGGEPSDALLVGLGSGITLGAMERYPLEKIDVVEIEPAVVEAARYFNEANENALEDPRVRLHITDGRSFLFAKKTDYDVVVSAVSDPWITGVANLFTLEYFEELDRKLDDDGVVALWFQNYRITPKELKIGLNTFATVFPHVSVWFHYTDTLDLIVIGSKRPHALDLERLRTRFGDPEIKGGLSRVDITEPIDVFDLFLIGDSDIRRYTGKTVLNTDERPVFEFTLPKLQYLDPETGVKTVEELIANVRDVVPPATIPEDKKEGFYLALGKSYNQYSFRLPQAYALFNKVLEINPDNAEAARLREELKKELNY